ncbi:lytic transglycosylase domain-containing protein [Pseudonocardia alni]|uniref:lytic transglycosylase domain-containing protein n=1 Tax=Pseudonocardia alni TaxID=33907 RepID=UPI003325C3C1
MPAVVFEAYRAAAATLATQAAGCHLDWSLLAAIGQVESGHARGGRVDATGRTLVPVLGPVLDGSGTAAIADTDGGTLDGHTVWDRAVGPMQFIPSTWRSFARDGSGDGTGDPHNVRDSALAAGTYLCAGGGDLSTTTGRAVSVLRYNHSAAYVQTVLSLAARYAGAPAPVVTGVLPDPGPPSGAVLRQAVPQEVASRASGTGAPVAAPAGAPSAPVPTAVALSPATPPAVGAPDPGAATRVPVAPVPAPSPATAAAGPRNTPPPVAGAAPEPETPTTTTPAPAAPTITPPDPPAPTTTEPAGPDPDPATRTPAAPPPAAEPATAEPAATPAPATSTTSTTPTVAAPPVTAAPDTSALPPCGAEAPAPPACRSEVTP